MAQSAYSTSSSRLVAEEESEIQDDDDEIIRQIPISALHLEDEGEGGGRDEIPPSEPDARQENINSKNMNQSEKLNENGKRKSLQDLNLKEKKYWKALKQVPVVNVVYGSIRSGVYALKGDKEESLRSLARAAGGIAEITTFVGATALAAATSVVAGPVVLVGTTVAVLVASSTASSVVGGTGELIIDAVHDENFSADREGRIYDQVIKDTVLIGGVYSATRAAVYKYKGDNEVAKESIKDAGVNLVSAGVGVLAGVGLAKIATRSAVATPAVVINQSWKGKVWSTLSSPFRSSAPVARVIPTPPASSLEIVAEKAMSAISSTTGRNVVASGSQQLIRAVTMSLDEFLNSDDMSKLPLIVVQFNSCMHSLKDSVERGVQIGSAEVKKKIHYVIKCLINGFLLIKSEFDELPEFLANLDPNLREILIIGIPALIQVIVAFAPAGQFVRISRFYETNRAILTTASLLFNYFISVTDLKNERNPKSSRDEISKKIREKEKDWQNFVPIPSYISAYRPESHEIRERRKAMAMEKLRERKRVLCIDGGGVRGLIPVEILSILELFMQENEGHGTTIKDCFDFMCGTSTGALIVLLLGMNKSLKEIQTLYFEMKDKIFSGLKPYSTNFDDLLKNFFGESRMKDIEGIRVIITATYGSTDHLKLKIFTNYGQGQDELIWKVARRTTSAPGFFNPLEEDEGSEIPYFYDGGLVSNNPTKDAFREIRDEMQNGIVVSLGTGMFPEGQKHLPLVKQTFIGKVQMLFSGDLQHLFDAFVHQITKTDGDVVANDILLSELANCHYYRITPKLQESVSLDETDNEKITNMIFHTKAYAALNQDTLREICGLITPSNQRI